MWNLASVKAGFDPAPAWSHAQQSGLAECCGLVLSIGGEFVYRPCRNIARQPHIHFIIDPADWLAAEAEGEIAAVVHSHPPVAPAPGPADIDVCDRMGIPWLIVSAAGHAFWLAPAVDGVVLPLEGRTFFWGILDCFSLVRDFYALELGIALPDVVRPSPYFGFEGFPLIDNEFRRVGFVEVGVADYRPNDLIVMQILGAKVRNHLAIYLPGQMILHQLANRKSEKTPWGGYWQQCHVATLRHESYA